jgi:hypothetical protein
VLDVPCRSIADVLAAFERRQICTDIRDNAECPEAREASPSDVKSPRSRRTHAVASDFRTKVRNNESPPSDINATELNCSHAIEIAADLPVSPATPWIDREKIAAANARDVLRRAENYSLDDRTHAQRSALGSHFVAVVRAVHKQKRLSKPKSPPKPKLKRERTPELREYYREYQRKLRAKQKAEALGLALSAESLSAL